MPRKVPTSALAIMMPSSAGGRPTDSMVCTTPMTAATMPNAGMPSASTWMVCDGTSASWWWVSISLSIRFSISNAFMLPLTIRRR